MPKHITLCLFSIHSASVQNSISQTIILLNQNVQGDSTRATLTMVAFAFIHSKTTIMRNRRGNSDLHHQVKMRSWERKDNRKIFVFFSNLRRETHFGQMFQEWVWDAELECFLLTISNFISYLALWSRKSVLQHESFCHIPDLKWIKLLTFIVCCSFAIFCKCLFFFHLLSLSGITADSVSIYAHYQCREKEKWPLVISSLELIPV